MKVNIPTTKEVNAMYVAMAIAVMYDDEDIPYDFPLRNGDLWRATIEIDTGKIMEWPSGEVGSLYMKVCDEGTYILLDENMSQVAILENEYVPNKLIPGSYGDYVALEINEHGIVTNWPQRPSLVEFFQT